MRINNLFESATAGGTSSGSVATVSKPLGKGKVMKRKADSIFAEDEETVIELSNEKLGQYKKGAGADASAADKAGDTKKADKRFSGIVKATKKQFANDAKKNVKEGLGRMSGSSSAYDRDYASSVSGMDRPHDHRGLGQELAHETNNIAISINGKVWKVVPGRGTADSREEQNYLNGMQRWAATKSAATGKKWSVSLTGANISEGIGGLGYEAQSLITKLRRDVEEKRLQPTPQAVLAAARELAGDMEFAPQLLVRQVLGQGVAEGLSKRDQQDVAAIRAAIARLESQLNHPNADKAAIQQSIAHEKKRLALYGQGVAEGFNGEYDDEAGMAEGNLLTALRAVKGLLNTIDEKDNLPEWAQEKIAKAEMMLVGVWDYLQSQKEQGIDPEINENKKGVRAVKYTAKPRNFVAKNAVATTSGAGAHKDKKKAAKQGEVKHKNKEPAYESKLFAALENKLK